MAFEASIVDGIDLVSKGSCFGIEGETTLELTVDAAGRVSSVTVAVSSGHPELDVAAVRAVKAAEFTPAQSGGSPVESSARLKLVFRLK